MKEGADKLEKWFVEYYDSTDPEKGYNGMTGGARVGAKMSEAGKERDRQSKFKNYPAPGFAKKIQSASKRVYEERPELREMIREQMKKRSSEGKNSAFIYSDKTPKPVRCVDTGEVYRSAAAAKRATGYSGVHKACSGIQNTAGGYRWRYLTEEEKITLF